jgi:Asp-tRNA(Asn)/Glu-tRNA(Gln) amidotransferase B subunit
MRVKEDADDYRYFREPDLVDLAPDQSWQDRIRAGLLPMPAERRQKLAALLSDLSVAHLDAVEVVINLGLDDLVMRAVDGGVDVTLAISRAANELAASIDEVKNFSSRVFYRDAAHGTTRRTLGDPSKDCADGTSDARR